MATLEEFKEAAGSVLFGKQPKGVPPGNRMPGKAGLDKR